MQIVTSSDKGWSSGPETHKIQALPEWGGRGGSDPCLNFCEGFVHMHWGPSKVIIHHPKVIISPTKVSLFPQKPHLFNIFTLKNDLRTFVEKHCESHLHAFVGQIRQGVRIRGWGVNPILAMPGFRVHMVPQATPNYAMGICNWAHPNSQNYGRTNLL